MSIRYRVYASKEGFPCRTISVAEDGSEVSCDCDSFKNTFRYSTVKFCSHIDATLLANERAMVPKEDWATIDIALKVIAGRLQPPVDWKSSWRRNFRWRGLTRAVRRATNPRVSNKPMVCFTGTVPGKTRAELIAEAESVGWQTTNAPSQFTDVLVAINPLGLSAKLRVARNNSTAIVSPDEWADLMLDGALPDRRIV